MRTANSGHGNDSSILTGIHFHSATSRRSFAQCQMRSVFMVVADVLTHEAFQMALIENKDMVEQVPAAVAGSGFRGALRIQRNTVRSETSKPSMINWP